jgi:ProP effector
MSLDLIEKLASVYPRAFFVRPEDRKPLKLGVHRDLRSDVAHGLSHAELRRAVGHYCRSPGYLAACTEGAERIDLNGLAARSVSAEAVGRYPRKCVALLATLKRGRKLLLQPRNSNRKKL